MEHNNKVCNYKICHFILLIFVSLYYQCFYIKNAIKFYKSYPDGYMWQEFFISYAGGIVRRGLSGSILFFLAENNLNIHIIIPLFIYIFTTFFLLYYVKEIYQNIDCKYSLFIILSPGCLFFMFYDPELYARKDIFIIGIYILIMHFIVKYNLRIIVLLFIGFLVFCGVLIHEMLLFYLPMPLYLLYIKYKNENINIKYFFIYCIFILSPIIIFILLYHGSLEHRIAIENQWATIIDNFKAGGGLGWIGEDIKRSSPFLRKDFLPADSWRNSVIIGYILTFLPIVLFCYRYKIFDKIIFESSSRVETFFFIFSVISPFFFQIIALDTGRGISLHAIEIVFFINFLCKIKKYNIKSTYNNINYFYFIPSVLIYSLSWHLIHFGEKGIVIYQYDFLLPIFIIVVFLYFFSKIEYR